MIMKKAIVFAQRHAAPWTFVTQTGNSINFKVYDHAESSLADRFAFANHIKCATKTEQGLYGKRISVTFSW